MNTYWGCFKGLGFASCHAIAGAVLQTFAIWGNCAFAQITADDTLPTNSIVTPVGNIFNITGGTRAGSNLFHSFQEFSVPNGRTASFNNATDIQNIISRVTGREVSNIDGLIRARGNLFLINPNGIIFNQNARLDIIGGSFIASTASSVKFADGFEFSATNPQSTSLLTINVPIGLQYGANPKPISNQSQFRNTSGEIVGLQVTEGRTLALVGGDVSLNGGILSAPGGQVELGGLAEQGTIGLNINGNNLSLSFPDAVERANVSLINGSEVNVASGGGGSIVVNARNLDILANSGFRAGISLLSGTDGAQAGDITINATGTLNIDNSFIYNGVLGFGNGGNISIDTGQLIIQDGVVAAGTLSRGRAGDVSVNANSVDLTGSARSDGTLTINIPINPFIANIFSIPPYIPLPIPIGLFSASLDARDYTNLPDIYLPQAGGNAGNLTIDTERLSARDGAVIAVNTTTSGRSGNLTLKATDVELIGTSLQDAPVGARLQVGGRIPSGLVNTTRGLGLGGDLSLETQRLVIRDGALAITGTGGTSGDKSAGNLTVNAESVTLSGTSKANGLPSVLAAGTQGLGDAGKLTINTGQLIVRDGAIVSAGTSNIGQGGDLIVNASDVQLIGTSTQGVSESVVRNFIGSVGGFAVFGILEDRPFPSGIINGTAGQGKAGDLTINTGRLLIQDGAQASVSTLNQGDAGFLSVRASSVELSGTSVLLNSNDIVGPSLLTSAVSQGSIGNGGNIDIFTDFLSLDNGAQISASTAGQGNAGKINVQVKENVSLDNNSQIRSTVEATAIGDGNQISIQGRSLSLFNGAQINAQTQGQGKAGSIDLNITEDITLDNNSQIKSTVEATAIGDGNQISIQGRSLSLLNGAQINAQTQGQGKAGSIDLNITEDITLSGRNSGIFASTRDSFVERGISVPENGDVGQLLDTAQDLTLQPGFYVTTISGNLRNNNDVDLYKIFLSGGQTFSATTVVGSNFDTQLFLFDDSGRGVYANDDSTPETRRSTLPALLPLTPTQPGFYYLGISSYNNDPQSTDGAIFPQGIDGTIDPLTDFTVGSVGPGGGSPLSNWNNRGFDINGNYTITLRGTAASQLVFQPGGDGGNIDIQARSLFATDGAEVAATTFGQGNAGNIKIVNNNLSVNNNAQISASTSGQGNAGKIDVQATEKILLTNNSQIRSTAESTATGNGNQVSIQGRSLFLANGAQITTETQGQGNAGSIDLNVKEDITLSGSKTGIFATTGDSSVPQGSIATKSGQGGNITVVQAQSLFVGDSAQVAATTFGQGKAGNVNINTSDTVFLDGQNTGVSANTAPNLTSQAGNLTITTSTLQVQNQASVTVSSPQGQAGNLNVTAKRVLMNGGNLIAETGITGDEEGANITLNDLDLLLMRNGSRISARASGSAKGGNIIIDAPKGFVIAAPLEDNDIIASASRGQGGNVVINTQRIFGFTQGKAIPGNRTNDIDVSSEFSNPGTVTINTLYIDPNRGLIPLPTNLVDASNQIATGCTPGSRQRANSFTATGRGGIAPSPTEPIIGDAVLTPWVTLPTEETETHRNGDTRKFSVSALPTSSPIVEASGWVVDGSGNVELVADRPSGVSHPVAQIPVLCR